jgi:hypothetical protein
MNTHADKSSENKSQAVAGSLSKPKGSSEAVFKFVDNRPQAVTQRKLQEAISNSPRVQQLKAAQPLTDHRTSLVAQLKESPPAEAQQAGIESVQKKENNTGLPGPLKTGIENLSGQSLDDVKVHYNSAAPARLQAHAYAQGTDIHIAPGQEKHLPHEAWHVVQQKQGRVKPTMQMKGKVNVNDDAGLEKEADVMGEKALQLQTQISNDHPKSSWGRINNPVQRKIHLKADIPAGQRADAIYDAIVGLFEAPDEARIKEQIDVLLTRAGDDGVYDLENQTHKELLYHQVDHLLKGNELGQGKETLVEKAATTIGAALGTEGNAYQMVFLGGGASIAYYVSTLGKTFDFSKACFIYQGQPWRTERGPGVIAHPEHMISPFRTYLGESMGDKGHAKMDRWMARTEFSDLIEGVVQRAQAGGAYLNHKVTNVSKKGSLYKITLDNGAVHYGHRVISGLGAGGHIIPKGLKPADLHAGASNTPLQKRIMNMDVFTQIAGHLERVGDDIFQRAAPVPNAQRGDITLVLSGGNAALDAAYDALAKGYKVKWITGSRGATFLPGFRFAARPGIKSQDAGKRTGSAEKRDHAVVQGPAS